MAFNIERGLFKFDFTDHHAVLGVPLDATANDIRKRYLKISRRLHPDSCVAETETLKQQASQFFAKIVNPAYEQLFNDQSRAEHNALLSRMVKRLAQEKEKIQLKSELAKKLTKSGNFEQEYKTAIQSLVEKQYEALDKVLEETGELSELNLVYLLRKSGQNNPNANRSTQIAQASSPPPAAATATGKPPVPGTPLTPQKKVENQATSPTEPYCRRAEEYIDKNVMAKAILELKDALKMEPNNSRCHGLLAMAYLKQDQTTMAKVHMNQALKLNPQEATALEVKKSMEKLAKQEVSTAQKQKQAQEKSRGGLFGLFPKKTDKNENKK